jgi:ABC-type tungstate transport system permease subunit
MDVATAHAQLGKAASSFLAGKHQLLIEGKSVDAKSGPQKHPHVKRDLGERVIDWLMSAHGRRTIAEYKINGVQLFIPNAKGSPS